jgi:fatty acid desaturase
LHHVIGHHKNFLDQTKDESRWQRKTGEKMGRLEYTLKTTFAAYPRGYLVGKARPNLQRDFIIFSAITMLSLLLLVILNPLAGLILFVLPMISSLLLTSLTTYGHHAGLDTKNEYEATHNKTGKIYNFLTGNLGYHTAHHQRGGLHWSKLPNLHEQIKHHIPDHLIAK